MTNSTDRRRVDSHGRAFKGSQLQLQIYVNRRRSELDAALRRHLPALETGDISWVSPLEKDGFAELRDHEFLDALKLGRLHRELGEFWPKGGPVWDALATVDGTDRDDDAVVLVEGKSHPNELRSSCKASEPARGRIAEKLDQTRLWLNGSGDLDPWMTRYYQLANRLAHLRFLTEQGVNAWLVLLSFSDDIDHVSTSRDELDASIDIAAQTLGISLLEHPRVVHVVLRSRPRSELLPAGDTDSVT